jgi:pyruvate,orthophosphate dikinase
MHEPTRYTFAFDEAPSADADERTGLLGGKGANLAVMAGLGMPVPAGFTITTATCRQYLERGWPDGLDEELRSQMSRLGERVGRGFADARDPLLVSVRSGAPVSMPGMMDTVLNLGLAPSTVDGLARAVGDQAFAADCLRRLQSGYREVIGSENLPDDPWVQLRAAIQAVFRSWQSPRAVAYRQREGISDKLATAVTIQAMVFGNRGATSATGVLFTRNPANGERAPYGDVMFNAQGEDVVAGGQATQPLSALDERLPQVADALRRHADTLERHYADMCDIEFTVEAGRLWILQVRVGKRSPGAALRMAIEMAQDSSFPLSRDEAVRRVAPLLADPPRVFVRSGAPTAPIGVGLPASPGVATGAIVTSSDAAEAAASRAAATEGTSLILVRPETSPEDVRGMARAAGIVTASGGLASHGAVVARGWGIPAVVGLSTLRHFDDRVELGGRAFAAGDEITIDGATGEVFAGRLAGEWQLAAEAATLLRWADELGIDIRTSKPDAVIAGSSTPVVEREVTSDDVLCALLIKGQGTPDQLAEALLATPDAIAAASVGLTDAGLVEATLAGLKLSAAGRLKAPEVFAADRAVIGDARAAALLEEFRALDRQMKEIVTAWQVRDVAGQQTLNDHSDAAYDAETLNRLAILHDTTTSWLAPTTATARRLARYDTRLARALERARAGEPLYIASPRVDSYHSIWFELHEHLIRLAGRRRSDESYAG